MLLILYYFRAVPFFQYKNQGERGMLFNQLANSKILLGIYSEIVDDPVNCNERCSYDTNCYEWESSKNVKIVDNRCWMYAYVNSTSNDNDTITEIFKNRENSIPSMQNYSTTLRVPNSDDLPYYWDDETLSNFNLNACASSCTNDASCVGFSGKPYATIACQYFYLTHLNLRKNVINFDAAFIYYKNSYNIPPPTKINSSTEPEETGLSPGAIAGITIAAVAVTVGLIYTCYRRCCISRKLLSDNEFNVDYDPQHDILLTPQPTCEELNREYVPNISVIE